MSRLNPLRGCGDPIASLVVGRLLGKSNILRLGLLSWCIAVGAGWLALASYAHRPGASYLPPSQWPVETKLPGPSKHACLLLFAHPRCPCTRATLSELERLLARQSGRLETCVVFTKPDGASEGWEKTDLLQAASAIEGVSTVIDHNGVEAERFRAHTSGVAMLYDKQGRLVFHGGLTSSRGHEGDSAGLAALRAFLDGAPARIAQTDVYGCPLLAPPNQLSNRDQECCKKN